MLTQFKKFITRGNVAELAVGVIIGGAFGKIVSSFVGDLLMPPIGLLLAEAEFANLFINLSGQHDATVAAAKAAGAPTLDYGTFLQAIVDFVIVAFAVFVLIKQVNRLFPPPGRAGSHHAPVPALPVADPAAGHALRSLHVGGQAGVGRFST